ncbi:MAG TPA: HD domain-containing protein [Bdellovibrionota bacterium]|nr:HD domain-containing protein [Bdellovibrionota bacterium]
MSAPETAPMELIRQDPALGRLFEEVDEKMKGDPGHDVAHLLRVAEWTLRLGEGKLASRRAIAAALLHDIVNVPKNSPDRSKASEWSAEESRKILGKLGFSEEEIQDVSLAVRQHSFSRGERPDTLLAKCLQDADRLETLGAIGLCRVISTGTLMGAAYFDSGDPWAERRELDDRAYSVDHFFRKIFKIPGLMNTEGGKREARHRLAIMHDFLAQLGHELGAPYRRAELGGPVSGPVSGKGPSTPS